MRDCIGGLEGEAGPRLLCIFSLVPGMLWKLPGNALRYVVGELSDTSSGAEFRAAIDAALAAQKGTP